MRSPKPAGLIVAAAGCLALLGAWTPFARSLIPLSLDGTVTSHERKFEKHAGVDDVYLVRVDGGRQLVLDRPVGVQLEVGERVRKRALEATLTTDDGRIALRPSADAIGMAVVMPASLLAVVGALRFGTGRRQP